MSSELISNNNDDCNINKTIYIELNEGSGSLPSTIKEEIEARVQHLHHQNTIAFMLFFLGFICVIPWLVNACLYIKSSNRYAKTLSIFSLILFILTVLAILSILTVVLLFVCSPHDPDHER